MLPHAGTDSAVWREVVELGGIVERLAEVAGSRVVSEVAVLFSWESWWATQSETRPSQALGYLDQVHASYRALHANGLTVDVVAPGADLSDYRMVVVPGLHLMSEADAAVLTAWIGDGGTALVTFSTAIVDENDRVYTGGYTGPLREALGLHIEEFAPVAPEVSLTLSDGSTARLWSERSRTVTAEVEASFTDGPAAGMPALTRNDWGQGAAWYLATLPSEADYRDLVARVAAAAGVAPAAVVEPRSRDLEIVRRRGELASYLFVINHGETDVHVDSDGVDLVTGTPVAGRATVPAGAVRIIREEAAA